MRGRDGGACEAKDRPCQTHTDGHSSSTPGGWHELQFFRGVYSVHQVYDNPGSSVVLKFGESVRNRTAYMRRESVCVCVCVCTQQDKTQKAYYSGSRHDIDNTQG